MAGDGDIWVAGGSGGSLLRYDATGALVEQLDVPDDFVSSCCLWPGSKRMVITTGTSVFLHEPA
ncbi:MAG: SMP-30/gluconolactonase/LRE family protein [Actinomycetota bacterium]